MTLQLRPTNGLTLEAFLEENGYRIYQHTGPHEIWLRCSINRLPVFIVTKGEHFQALVAYSLDEVTRICLENNLQAWSVHLVKIVDLLPHVERLDARLKERARAESEHKRLGRFAVPFEFLDRADPFARAIMDNVLVLRAEALYGSREISYVAYSDMFEEVQLGVKIPDYLWTATRDDHDNIIELKADRVL